MDYELTHQPGQNRTEPDMSGGVRPRTSPETTPFGVVRVCPADVSGLVRPLDTPPDWHERIARRQREWRELGPVAAARLWHQRGECGKAVMAVVEGMEWR